jgi:hypothetical protein
MVQRGNYSALPAKGIEKPDAREASFQPGAGAKQNIERGNDG